MRLFRKRFARLRMIVAKAHHFTVEERKEFSVYFNIYEKFGHNITALNADDALIKYFKKYKHKHHAEHREFYWGVTDTLGASRWGYTFKVTDKETKRVYYYG